MYPHAEPTHWETYREQVREWSRKVPSKEEIAEPPRQAGGPSTLQELGIDDELFRESLQEAHSARPPYHFEGIERGQGWLEKTDSPWKWMNHEL